MNDFSWLKKYSHNEKDFFQERPNDKHSFLKISTLEVEEQEKKFGRKFPGELRDFYLQIGAGSLCVNDHENFDEIMSPEDVTNFILGMDYFETCSYRDELDMSKYMVFFSLGDNIFFSLDLSKMDENGVCPVVDSPEYTPIVLANSIHDFILKMEEKVDFYKDFW